MKQQKAKLGIREYAAIAILMTASKATEDTPMMLYSHVNTAAWMIPILSGAIFFIAYSLLIKTFTLHQEETLFDLIQRQFGKHLGWIICLLIFVINSGAISFDSRTYTNIIGTIYFTTTPKLIIYAIFMFVCAYGAKKGIQHVGSVSYTMIFYVLASFYLVLLICAQDINPYTMFPLWGTGAKEVLKESLSRVTLFADFFILTILVPYVTSFKDFKKSALLSYFYVIFHLSIAILIFILLFDVMLIDTVYPFHASIRFISIGRFLTNIETLFLPIWLMGAFIRFSAFLYINAHMFGRLFNINDYEYLIPALAAIYLLIGMIPESALEVALNFKQMSQFISGPFYVMLSFLIWVIALIKGEFKHAKENNSM